MDNALSFRIQSDLDHFRRISKARVDHAIAELIWNSLDADADNIKVSIKLDSLDNNEIVIKDDGDGIDYEIAKNHFIKLGGSWKTKCNTTKKLRSIHGEKGEGRFKAFSLGRIIQWNTTYKKNDQYLSFQIRANAEKISHVSLGKEVINKNVKNTGTTVQITELNDAIFSRSRKPSENRIDKKIESIKRNLTLIFAPFLITYPEIKIYINDEELDPSYYLKNDPLEIPITKNGIELGSLKLLLWKDIIANDLYLCKDNGAVLIEYNNPDKNPIRPLNYKYSAYIKSPIFNEETIGFPELNEEVAEIITISVKLLNEEFQKLKDIERSKRIDRWIEEGIYPYEKVDSDNLGIIQQTTRDVFDIVAVNVENKIKSFQVADAKTKQFTFKLLAQALEQNPESVQKIITELLNLSPDEQKLFANLLQKTSLSSIIKSAKIVTDRLNFLLGLDELLFKHKESLLERDQLHKILEKESWIFDEQFALSGSEKRLEDVLNLHLNLLGKRGDDSNEPVLINDEKQGRVDLMLHKVIETSPGYRDYLIVELKRPSKKITAEVINQIEDYAHAISSDSRFDSTHSKWKFIAVSIDLDKHAERRRNDKAQSAFGRILTGENYEIYIFKWSEILNNARTRLKFYEDQLLYQADDQSLKKYLLDTHSEFLPKTFEKSDSDRYVDKN